MFCVETNQLTPGIKLAYADLKPIPQEEGEAGYLLYTGKSFKTGEVHEIRTFNSFSMMAKGNLHLAMTIFLKEMLRLCALYYNSGIKSIRCFCFN